MPAHNIGQRMKVPRGELASAKGSSGVIEITGVVNKVIREATLSAFKEIGDRMAADAAAMCPVRQVFKDASGTKPSKSMTGKFGYLAEEYSPSGRRVGIGRGAGILIHRGNRSLLNQRQEGIVESHHGVGRRDLVIGREVHHSKNSNVTDVVAVAHEGINPNTGAWTSTTTYETSTHRRMRETREFVQDMGGEVRTPVGRTAKRSGTGTRIRYASRGYALKAEYDRKLTSRARYNLARGIGAHKIGRQGSYSKSANAGDIVIGGALRDSIRTRVERNGETLSLVLVAGNHSVDYAEYVEYGTWKDAAQPFMRPAMKNAEGYAPAILKAHLKAFGFDSIEG